MDKFKVDMPDEFEIKSQINTILDKGLKKQESFYLYIKNMYKSIGIKNLFHDKSELIFIAIVVISILTYLSMRIYPEAINLESVNKTEEIYVLIFTVSPLYYLATNIFSFINLKENKTYEVEMVCKYNVYQLASLRMLVFSVIAVIINTIFVSSLYEYIDVLRGIMISITSVFLFSSILLYSLVKIKSKYIRYMVIAGWILVNVLLVSLSLSNYANLLQNIPILVYVAILTLAIYSYIKNIQILSRYKKVNFA
ncbi:hypothetical protein [Clostridium sp. CCUG 7971]|uniref:hypothetical protein n=1 Tax=Clostridium sp. CCUG 7971 TaxID=2811414 RepID=UPI001ABAADF2|nr:hypothetical protein [Clostridium sp. CCUG 7971]MBO3445581.1 hypothetical protein [Clostridium sp. CCUG 7971]